MNNNDKMFNESLLKLQTIIERVVEIAQLMQQGDIETAKVEIDELYIESVHSEVDRFSGRITKMIEHLLKLAYCDSYHDIERDARGWEVSINKHRRPIMNGLNWCLRKEKTNVIRGIDDDMDITYAKGVQEYCDAIQDNPSLVGNKHLIPSDCPWKLRDLLEMDNIDLVEMLEGHTEYYRQYLDLNPETKSRRFDTVETDVDFYE